jgi:hypothetical protein
MMPSVAVPDRSNELERAGQQNDRPADDVQSETGNTLCAAFQDVGT